MSLINAMLQDLDRRQALGPDTAAAAVRAPAIAKPRREWFWHSLAILMAISVAWVGWVAFQIMPRPLVTIGLNAGAADSRPQPSPPARALVPEAAPAQPISQPVSQPVTAPAVPLLPAPFEILRLATELQAPVVEPAAPKARLPRPEALKAPEGKPAAPKKPPAKGSVNKFDRVPSGSSAAAGEFRRAVALLNQGRVAEAQQLLAAALKTEPGHANARQVYVALLLEQGRVEPARRLLEEGLQLSPGHAAFSLSLARIHTEQREFGAALGVMDKVAGGGAGDGSFQALRGAVLQRLGRHAEAVDAYQGALRLAPQQATSWLGLAISLETLGKGPEAAEAYRRALGAGPLAPEAQDYAETRARALQ
jgi:MSHA biogenesis protein MshN